MMEKKIFYNANALMEKGKCFRTAYLYLGTFYTSLVYLLSL